MGFARHSQDAGSWLEINSSHWTCADPGRAFQFEWSRDYKCPLVFGAEP